MKEKNKKYVTEEQQEVKKFIFVLIGLIVIIVGIYFFTRAFVTKDLFHKTGERNYQTGTINYDMAIVGNMLSKPYSAYYVMAFSNEDAEAVYYNTLVTKYISEQKDKALKVYHIDLDDAFNKPYVSSDGESSTLSKKFSIDDLKLGKITLMYVKDGKITKILSDVDSIKKEFGI